MATSAGERRVVSVLLADVADSTTIGEQLGPERSKFLFDEIVRLIAGEVKRYGGTVAQLTGDGLYALFGVPHAHDDDAERAVRSALAIQEVLAGYAGDVAAAYGIQLATRVGVNTGSVVLLPDDAPADERYNALGDTVNVAARLQTHAGPRGVAIGPATARQVEAAFELESLGPLDLKGKAAPTEAYRVAGERAVALKRASPLVGRHEELAALEGLLSGVVEGRGGIACITGEPGIGKTRLVAEVRSHWSDVRFLGAQGVSYAQDVPYYPLRELLRGFLEVGLGDPETRVRLELKMQLSTTLGERADALYPFLASLLGLVPEEEVAERLKGLARDSIQRQTHEAVVELCRAVSTEQPLCVVLEDLHFADEPTLELAEELLALTDEEAVVLLLCYRSDPDLRSWEVGEAARRRYRHRYLELHLQPLAPDDGARLAEWAAGGDLPASAAADLAGRTGGNPLFLEEAARDLVERGDEALVPAAIQETLQARLDRLAPDTREVAAIASVVGRSFGTPLLERVVAAERLRPALSELQRLDLVVEERRRPTPEYRFRHGLVQEAAYRTLLEDRRRELHRIVGVALEELHGDELSEAYGLLAHHFAEAEEPDRAARYLLKAGDAARAVFADEAALIHYRRALSFLDRLGNAEQARAVLFKIALEHHLAFEFEAADAAWSEAFVRPEPAPVQLEPTEALRTALARSQSWVPGHGYDIIAWCFGPNLFRGLLRLGRGLDVLPDLSERVSVSADGCAYTFRLRSGLRWSDGERLTADDFAFTYRAMQEQSVGSANLLEGVEARAIDEYTLELRLAEPRAYMLYLFAQLPFFPWPRHKVEELGPAWHETTPVGNGPFVLEEQTEGEALLVANRHWHGSRGNVRQIRVAGEVVDARTDWADRSLDFLLQPHLLPLDDLADTTRLPIPVLSVSYLAFPPQQPFDDGRVRKAFAHGLDRAPIVASTGSSAAYGGFLPPAMPGHSHDLAPVYDVEQARALLAAAGYPDGRGLPELRLLHPDPGFSDSFRGELEGKWNTQWRELGVRLKQEWVRFEEMSAEVAKGVSLWEWGWVSDYPDPNGMLGTFVEGQPVPADVELTTVLSRARSLRSRDEQLELYRRADRILVAEQAFVIPTTYDVWHLLHRSSLQGMWTHPLGMGTLDEVVVRR